jgi:hypothetical protein
MGRGGQIVMEYFLIFAVMAMLVFLALNSGRSGGVLNAASNSLEQYFSKAATANSVTD